MRGKLLRYLIWFSGGLIVGLSPLLGHLKLPFFSTLLDLYPPAVGDILLLSSGILMGIIAAIVDFASKSPPSIRVLKRYFYLSAFAGVCLLLVLVALFILWVTPIQTYRGTARFITGNQLPDPLPADCECTDMGPGTCVEKLAFNVDRIRRCFGTRRVLLMTLSLGLLYHLVTGCFALVVGLLLLRVELLRRRQRKQE